MKTIVKRAAMAGIGILVASQAFAQCDKLTVSGSAQLKSKPDVAYVTVYVKGEGILMTDAANKADIKVGEIKKAVLDKFKYVQLIEVTDVGAGEAQREMWRSDQKEEGPRPEIARRIRFTLPPDPVRAYEIVDAAIRAGASLQIQSSVTYPDELRSIVIYGLLKCKEIEAKALAAAIDDAKQEAQRLAAAVGKKTGEITGIGCSDSFANNLRIRVLGRESEFPTTLVGTDPKEILINTSISITFELK